MVEAKLADPQVAGDALVHDEGEWLVAMMLSRIGDDPKRDGLIGTPERVARSWRDLYAGYRMDPAAILARKFENATYDQMIVLRDVELYSTCEHHMLPFYGKAHLAYVPSGGVVVGLSKLARLVDCFARRLQIQERLTEQIADAIAEHVSADAAVMIEARHMCMLARGVTKQNSVMVTSALRGAFKTDGKARDEFLRLGGGIG